MLSLSEILEDDVQPVTEGVDVGEEGGILYPQANSLDKVLEVVLALRVSGMSVYDMVKTGIVNSSRQARYYYNAAAFLGFCYRRGDYFYPTEAAEELLKCESAYRRHSFAAMVLENSRIEVLFTKAFRYRDKEARICWIEDQIAPNISAKATLRRRASCLHAWLAWIQQNLPAIKG